MKEIIISVGIFIAHKNGIADFRICDLKPGDYVLVLLVKCVPVKRCGDRAIVSGVLLRFLIRARSLGKLLVITVSLLIRNYIPYNKNKGKIEFVGIDCNDTEDKWKKAVAEHQLPWINVRNIGEPDVAVMYGVSGYPTKYVIDPEGKIAKQVVGEDPEFYMYLEALMK